MLAENDDREIEKAVSLLVSALERRNRKSKPVIMHSLRVGLYLYGLDCSLPTVIAGVLHDTVEASDVTPGEISEQFGPQVAQLVEANSNDERVQDKVDKYKDTFRRCMEKGREALLIKGADLLDNTIHVYQVEQNAEKRDHDLEKVRYFLDVSVDGLKGSRVWTDLQHEYEAAR